MAREATWPGGLALGRVFRDDLLQGIRPPGPQHDTCAGDQNDFVFDVRHDVFLPATGAFADEPLVHRFCGLNFFRRLIVRPAIMKMPWPR